MTRPTDETGARVERRKPRTHAELETFYLARAEGTRQRAAMAKLVAQPGGRDVWNARRSVLQAREERNSTSNIDDLLATAQLNLDEAIRLLGGGALLAAPEKEGAE